MSLSSSAVLPASGPDQQSIDFTLIHPSDADTRWWRSSVIYQVYPRSFRDLSGDGIGDLNGITTELHQLAELDIDAVWLSPFYTSPQKDGGYDVSDYCDVDPLFGTLADFDALVARASELGIRVIIDLVPNHCSNEHPLFQAALSAEPGSPERDLFIFRDGTGADGELPPNNWQSHFGGSAWTRTQNDDGTPGQWYLHLFDSSQPDFNWDNEAVRTEFERILRFWLDRGVSGFRVDVAHALVKAAGLPDWGGRADGISIPGFPGEDAPMFGQEEVHEIFRSWRRVLDSYDGDRVLCAEASIDPLPRLANWVRPDEMHQTFNFAYLGSAWEAPALRKVVTESLSAFDAVSAPTTWVLSNHDVVRHTTRLGLTEPVRGGDGIGALDPQPDAVTGLSRARAATLAMLALPGGVYLYQGEELGLPDHTSMSAEHRQDPSFFRTGGERLGRDGCRVPLPWTANAAGAYGFSAAGQSWLPQPGDWAQFSRHAQREDGNSTLNLYKTALRVRRERALGSGSLAWADGFPEGDVVAFANGSTLVVINMGPDAVDLPPLDIVVASETGAGADGTLRPNHAVWLDLPAGEIAQR